MQLELEAVTFVGEALRLKDEPLLSDLPADLVTLLRSINGFVAYGGGGLHVRVVASDQKPYYAK